MFAVFTYVSLLVEAVRVTQHPRQVGDDTIIIQLCFLNPVLQFPPGVVVNTASYCTVFFSMLASLHPTWKLLIWLCIVKTVLYTIISTMLGIFLFSFLSDSSTPESKQFNLQWWVQGCPAQWGLCGFPGCALDVVYVFRLLCKVWAAVVIPFILWHVLEIWACEQMRNWACQMCFACGK